MKNLLNIEDQVKINMPGACANGKVVKVTSMNQFKDGKILYIGEYHQDCPQGNQGFNTTVQFGEGQYEVINQHDADIKILKKYGKKEIKNIEVLSKPLVDYLKKKQHPYCSIIITDNQIRLTEDMVGIPVKNVQTSKS